MPERKVARSQKFGSGFFLQRNFLANTSHDCFQNIFAAEYCGSSLHQPNIASAIELYAGFRNA